MFARDPLADPKPLIERVFAYIVYRLGDGPDAEDLMSEVLERALRFRSSYDPRKGEPAAWMVGIARRLIDGRRQPLAWLEPPDLAAPGDLEEETVRRLSLWAAIATLEERDRELIALRYGADLSIRQIGKLLGLKTNTVQVALGRTLARVRSRLEAEESLPHAGRQAGVRGRALSSPVTFPAPLPVVGDVSIEDPD